MRFFHSYVKNALQPLGAVYKRICPDLVESFMQSMTFHPPSFPSPPQQQPSLKQQPCPKQQPHPKQRPHPKQQPKQQQPLPVQPLALVALLELRGNLLGMTCHPTNFDRSAA